MLGRVITTGLRASHKTTVKRATHKHRHWARVERCTVQAHSRHVAQALERRGGELALALDVGGEADLVDVVAEGGLVARGGDHDGRPVGEYADVLDDRLGSGVGVGLG